jgi:hypothetical protein
MVQHLVPSAQILDWGPTPTSPPKPRFYGANYLWAPIPGLPCSGFTVTTTIDGEPATPAAIRAYKARIGKEHEVLSDDDLERLRVTQFPLTMRGYDLDQYPVAFVRYNCHVDHIDLERRRLTLKSGAEPIDYDYLASTIPLPNLLAMADTRVHGLFRSQPVRVRVLPYRWASGNMFVDYITDTTVPQYRRTLRFNECHDETLEHKFPGNDGEFHRLLPGKIWDCPRTPEFLGMLEEHGVYTFGRYGSWNSDELVHETLKRIAGWAIREGLEVSEHARHVAA